MANRDQNYDRLGKIIGHARMAGEVSWTAMQDMTRFLRGNIHKDDPADVIASAIKAYKIDMWQNQRRLSVFAAEGVERWTVWR